MHAGRGLVDKVENAACRRERTVNKLALEFELALEDLFEQLSLTLSSCPATSGGAEATETAVPASSRIAS